MRSTALIALLLLTACAPRLSAANERGGIIHRSGSLGTDRAFQMANGHCEKFGRVARISGRDMLSNSWTFDCVEK